MKKFIVFFLAAAHSIFIDGGNQKDVVVPSIYNAITCPCYIIFDHLTPAQEAMYLPQINGPLLPAWHEEAKIPIEYAAENSASGAIRWLIKRGATVRGTYVLKKALDSDVYDEGIDLESIVLLLEHGAYRDVSCKCSVDDLGEATWCDKKPSDYVRDSLESFKRSGFDEGDPYIERQGRVIALLERFESASPARAAWMGAVYKGIVVRGRATGVGATPSAGPVLSIKPVGLVE